MKKAFSLLELIFAIVVLAIIASFAVPKYLDTKDSALISTLQRDLSTTVTSIQSYYLLNQKIDKISEAVNLNDSNWTITDSKITDINKCVNLEIVNDDNNVKTIVIKLDSENTSNFCEKVKSSSIKDASYELL